jgi:hypothetical protein
MLTLRDAFQVDKLLLIDFQGDRPSWVGPQDVLYNIPSFCRFTTRYPGRKTIRPWLRDALRIQPWNTESHLLTELQGFEDKLRKDLACVGDWKATCHYIFRALEHIVHHLPASSSPTKRWISDILKLKIYPITDPDGSNTLRYLSPNIFVPDSPLLNPLLQHKVYSLNFGGQYISSVIPLLRLMTPPLKFLSSYDNDRNVQIPTITTQSESTMKKLKEAKWFIAR